MNFSKNNIVLPQNATKATKATLEVKASGRRWKAIWRCAPKIRRNMRSKGHMGLETWSFGHYLENVQTDFGDNASNEFGKILDFWVFAKFLVVKIGWKSWFLPKKLQSLDFGCIVNFASELNSEWGKMFFEPFLGYPATSWYPEKQHVLFLQAHLAPLAKTVIFTFSAYLHPKPKGSFRKRFWGKICKKMYSFDKNLYFVKRDFPQNAWSSLWRKSIFPDFWHFCTILVVKIG